MGTMQSGKILRRNLDLGTEYNPLLGVYDSIEESSILKTYQGEPQTLKLGIVGIPHPSTPPNTPSPPLFKMGNAMKMLIFEGFGKKHPKQFCFVANVVRKSQQITDDDLKKV